MSEGKRISEEAFCEIVRRHTEVGKEDLWQAYKDAVINGIGMTKDGKYVVVQYALCAGAGGQE